MNTKRKMKKIMFKLVSLVVTLLIYIVLLAIIVTNEPPRLSFFRILLNVGTIIFIFSIFTKDTKKEISTPKQNDLPTFSSDKIIAVSAIICFALASIFSYVTQTIFIILGILLLSWVILFNKKLDQ